jgi:hypothetical protein
LIRRCVDECGVIPDHHGLVFELSRSPSGPAADVTASVMDAIRQVAQPELLALERQVDSVLNGEIVREPNLPPVEV